MHNIITVSSRLIKQHGSFPEFGRAYYKRNDIIREHTATAHFNADTYFQFADVLHVVHAENNNSTHARSQTLWNNKKKIFRRVILQIKNELRPRTRVWKIKRIHYKDDTYTVCYYYYYYYARQQVEITKKKCYVSFHSSIFLLRVHCLYEFLKKVCVEIRT